MKRKYSCSQITIHWLVFITIVVAFAAMELKGFTPKGSQTRATMAIVHYTAGACVLVLMAMRVVLKITHRDPEILPAPPRWQIIVAKAVHGILYLMFITLPFLGIASLYFGQVEWTFFGITMPVTGIRDTEMQHTLKEWHELIANAGYFFIGLHALAALFHHYIVRDNTLVRMLPKIKK